MILKIAHLKNKIMKKFKVIETEKVLTSYVYEVEAETKEGAIEKYVNELAGSIPEVDCYSNDSGQEGIVAIEITQGLL